VHEELTAAQVKTIVSALSAARLETYIAARDRNRRRALSLYEWNAVVSAAFMVPLHICEVVLRNTIVEEIERVYGSAWHMPRSALEGSLPRRLTGYSAFTELARARTSSAKARDIVPNLTFMFWTSMLTRRHDARLWNVRIKPAFPHLPAHLVPPMARRLLHHQVDAIRVLRNRIAHHEPIFSRDLHAEYRRIRRVVFWRSPDAASWLDSIQAVTTLIPQKP
jgi:hypothetical protein